jgi:hypothetical protein
MTIETEYPALLAAVRNLHPKLVGAIEARIALLEPTTVSWQPHDGCALGRWTAHVDCTPDEAERLTGALQQVVGSPPAELRVVTVS